MEQKPLKGAEPFDCAPIKSLRVFDRIYDRELGAQSKNQESVDYATPCSVKA
jgi:hypothetical protein